MKKKRDPDKPQHSAKRGSYSPVSMQQGRSAKDLCPLFALWFISHHHARGWFHMFRLFFAGEDDPLLVQSGSPGLFTPTS